MRGSGSGSENKIANREPFWEPDHAANLVQPRTCTENTSAVLSVKADLSDQSERMVANYGSEDFGACAGYLEDWSALTAHSLRVKATDGDISAALIRCVRRRSAGRSEIGSALSPQDFADRPPATRVVERRSCRSAPTGQSESPARARS